ncbi:MAG: type II secretion system protein GspM [Gammaproteobacteria bacterium]
MQLSSKFRQRALALGILLIALLLFFLLLVEPYMSLLNASEDYVESATFQLNQADKILNKKEFYSDEIERLESFYSEQTVYLESTKKALASAEIQQILKRISAASKAELLSSQAITSESTERNRVGLRVRVRTDIVSLYKLLYALESGIPNLFVDKIQINRAGRAIFKFNNNELSNQGLDVSLQVYGYVNNNSL